MSSFESIVTGQLPPDDWYSLSLNHDYECVEANSNVGYTALALADALARAEYQLDCAHENEKPTKASQRTIDIAEREFNDTLNRFSIFYDIYHAVSASLKNADTSEHSADELYQNAVTDAHQEVMNSIDESEIEGMPPKDNLRLLANVICEDLANEQDLHFIELVDELRVQSWLAA